MKCPFCTQSDSRVVESRMSQEQSSIRRRRQCLSCSRRFTTYERVESVSLVVIKKSGRREPFERAKLLAGLCKAAEKREVPLAVLEKLVEQVESLFLDQPGLEMSTQVIGQFALEKLRQIDEVAYVRFASVYREFSSIEEFLAELQKLQKTTLFSSSP